MDKFELGKKYIFSKTIYYSSDYTDKLIDKYIDLIDWQRVTITNDYIGCIMFLDTTIEGDYRPIRKARILPEWCMEVQ